MLNLGIAYIATIAFGAIFMVAVSSLNLKPDGRLNFDNATMFGRLGAFIAGVIPLLCVPLANWHYQSLGLGVDISRTLAFTTAISFASFMAGFAVVILLAVLMLGQKPPQKN